MHELIIITSYNQIHNTRDYQSIYFNGDSGLVIGDNVSFPMLGKNGGTAIGTVVNTEHNGSFITIRMK